MADKTLKSDKLERRRMLQALAGLPLLAGAGSGLYGALAASPASAGPPRHLDPVNPDIRFGMVTGIWDVEGIERAFKKTAQLGFEGLECYPRNIPQYVRNPAPLIKMYQDSGLEFISCSNGAAGETSNFIDPKIAPKTIEDHMRFAREFLVPFKASVWKVNLGRRPAGGPNADQLRTMAETLNALGAQTAALGIKLSPHPHIWGPLEREHEVRQVMALTDPKYVWLTMDTGHLALGGMNPVKMIDDYFPRVAEIHFKDCLPQYVGNKSTPTPEEHERVMLYKGIGAGGGVDFPGVMKVLRDRHFKGWIALDLTDPIPGDGTGTVDDNLAVCVNYLRDKLGVKLPAPKPLAWT